MYRLTTESGAFRVIGRRQRRQLLRAAVRRGIERTRVRGGVVLTLPDGALVAVLKEAP